ncbi:Ig-like domain-containing protein, partial [Litorivicinus sp.]|nr:Ig-like domain-containing protein [Litorivicinus sp.]
PDSDALTVTAATLSGDTTGSLDFSDGANILYTPGANFNGTATISYTVTDDGTTDGSNAFLTDSGSITIVITPVADSPVTDTTPATYSASVITQDSTDVVITLVEPASLVDVDGDRLDLFSISLDSGGSHVVNYDSNGDWDGTVTYTPVSSYAGDEVISYAVTDGVEIVNLSLTIPVEAGVNEAPIANTDTQSVPEDTQTATQIPVLLNDTDAEADSLTVTAVTISGTSAEFGAGPGVVTTDGTYVNYTPAAGFVGTETISYTITDDGTSNNLPDPLTGLGTVTVTVTNVNDPPIVADPGTTTTEGVAITVPVGTDSTYVSDPEGDVITVDTVEVVGGDSTGLVSIDGSTGITYTPSDFFNGTTIINYQVTDDGTTDSAADPQTTIGTLTIVVTADAINSAPVAGDDTQTVIEDVSTTSIDVLANDTDVDAADTLTITNVSTTGTGSVTTDGSLIFYTPAANFNGIETITYIVRDDDAANGGVGSLSDAATLVVRVLAQDDPPAVSAVSLPAVSENSTTTLTLFSSLVDANDGDAIALTNVSGNSGSTIVNNGDGSILYTPFPEFIGNEEISYTVTDSTGLETQAAVVVTVIANAAPVVDSTASSSVTENSTLNVINLIATVSDADANDVLSITSITSNNSGTTVVGVDGISVTYTPDPEFFGIEILTFEVTDGTNAVTGFHTMIVTENDTTIPTISADFPRQYVAGIGSQIAISVVGALDENNTSYVEDDSSSLYVRIVDQPLYGTGSTNGNDIFYTSYSTAQATVDDSMTFEIFDGSNVSEEIAVTINLVPANVGTCSPGAISLDDPTLEDGCTITPTGYRIPVSLFGLCTADPAEPTATSAYDLSDCSFFFDGRSTNETSTITFGGINETTTYSGAINTPDFGIYTHGVIMVGTAVEMKGSLLLSGSSTPYCVTGDYANNIQCFAADVDENFVADDPISYLFESGVYSYEFPSDNVSVYLVDDLGQLITSDGAGSTILAIQEFSSAQSFSDTTSSIDIKLGISDSLILNNGAAKAAPFIVDFQVQ